VNLSMFRLILYIAGTLASVFLAGRLFSINHILAKLWGVSQIVWALVCTAMITMLVRGDFGPGAEDIRAPIMTIISILLAICPVVVYLGWGRNGGLSQ